MPCVIGATRGLNEPRYPKLPDIMKAKKKEIRQIDIADLGLDLASPLTEIINLEAVPERGQARILEGSADGCKEALQSYGVQKIVALGADGCDLSSSPDLQAAALVDAINHFSLTALLGLSSALGRDLLARVAALMDAPLVQDCVGVDIDAQTVTKSNRANPEPLICLKWCLY